MQHRFDYELNGESKVLESSMAVEGKDSICTAMAITVGYPVAIASKLILTGEITSTGVKLPTTKDIYEPVLKELEEYGIKFTDKEIEA
jgi:saccharopine dehydrogenase-like NADP-dependent oxidoreductase